MAKSFSLGEAFKFGWDTWKEKWAFFSGLMLISFLIAAVSMARTFLTPTGISMMGILTGILMYLLTLALGLGMIKVYLGVVDGGQGQYRDLLGFAPYFIKYLLGLILQIMLGTLLMTAVAIILMVAGMLIFRPSTSQVMIMSFAVTGVSLLGILALVLKWQFFGYLLVDRRMGPVQATKGSWRLTRGVGGKLVLFWLTALLMQLPVALVAVGWSLSSRGIYLLPFSWQWQLLIYVVNQLIAVPITSLACAKIYRSLSTGPEAVEPVIPAAPAETM